MVSCGAFRSSDVSCLALVTLPGSAKGWGNETPYLAPLACMMVDEEHEQIARPSKICMECTRRSEVCLISGVAGASVVRLSCSAGFILHTSARCHVSKDSLSQNGYGGCLRSHVAISAVRAASAAEETTWLVRKMSSMKLPGSADLKIA